MVMPLRWIVALVPNCNEPYAKKYETTMYTSYVPACAFSEEILVVGPTRRADNILRTCQQANAGEARLC